MGLRLSTIGVRGQRRRPPVGRLAVRMLCTAIIALLVSAILPGQGATTLAASPGPSRPTGLQVKGGGASASARAEAAPGTSTASSESEAAAQARASGEQVEVGALRGESREVFAQPDGTFVAVQHLRPVRTRRGGQWVGVDATLTRRADGSVGPLAATVDLAFSGGGPGPMVSMTSAGRRLSMSWSGGPLPVPALSGSVATYPNVLPGVDLQLRAEVDGFSDVLVVKARPAASERQLAQLRFALSTSGLLVDAEAGGGLQAVDAHGGGAVFEAPQPLMWDSATTAAAPNADPPAMELDMARAPSGTAHQAGVGVQVGSGAVTLTPNHDLLTDSATVFPVFIDPVFKTVGESANLMVANAGFKTYNFSGDEGMGLCPYSFTSSCGSTNLVKRLFYRMPTSAFGGKTIISAELQIRETFAPSCEDHAVQLWRTKSFTSSSTWSSTSDNWLEQLDSKSVAMGFSGCPAGDVIFDATTGVKEAAKGEWSTLTVGLRAATEDCQLCWKRFDNDASLRVHYDTPPQQPKMSDLSMNPGGACVSPPGTATNTLPTMFAVLRDADKDDQLYAQFAVGWDADGDGVVSEQWRSGNIGPKAPGSTFSLKIPSNIGLPQNRLAYWKVRTWDGFAWSPWSLDGSVTGCYLTYDPTVPAAPAVSSTDYPASNPDDRNDPWIDGVGRYGSLVIASGSTDVVRYTYQLNDGPVTTVKPAAAGGAVTIKVMPTRPGIDNLYAQAFTAAGTASSVADYMFRVRAGSPARAAFDLDDPAGTDHVTGVAGPYIADVAGGAQLGGVGKSGAGLHLDGVSGRAATGSPVVRTDASYSVAAWVRLSADTTHFNALSQDGTTQSGFQLGFNLTTKSWGFKIPSHDEMGNSGPWNIAAASDTAPLNTWAHLVGVYDASAHQMRLYVNGQAAASVANVTAWHAGGGFQIGRSLFDGSYHNYWPGDIDDVQAYQSVLSGDDVAALYANGNVSGEQPVAEWSLDEAAGSTQAAGTAINYVAGLHGGATLGVAGTSSTGLQLNGTDAYAATTGPLVDTTASFAVAAWVNVARKSGVPVVVSQETSGGSAFALYYQSSSDRWEFNMRDPDGGTGTFVVAQSRTAPDVGQWTHLAGVYDAVARTISLYVDGVLQQTVPQPASVISSGPLNVGRYRDIGGTYGAQYYFDGSIDDLDVFDRVLTVEEVQDLSAQRPVVAARWTFNNDTSTIATPKAYWKSDDAAGSTTIVDAEGAFPATTSGAVTLGVAGKTGTAMNLDAAGHGYAATSGPVLDTTSSFSISGWVRLSAKSGRPVAMAVEGSRNAVLALYYSDFWDRWVLRMQTPDSDTPTQVTIQSVVVPQANAWTQLTGVYDAAARQIRLYVDGKLQATASQPDTWNAAGPVELGRMIAAGGYASSNYWTGALDEVRVFDSALTDSDAAGLAGSGHVAADDSTFGRHVTLSGNAHIDSAAAWIGTGALNLDGDGDYAATSAPVLDTAQSFTVAGWVSPAGVLTQKAAIFSQAGATNSGFTLRYDPAAVGGSGGYEIDMPDKDASGASHVTADHSSFQATGDWDHVAIVYDAFADEMRLYVNGELEQTEDRVSYRFNVQGFNADGGFQIGRTRTDGTWAEYWPGLIDDVWAFDGVLSDEQIANLADPAVELPTYVGP